MFGIASDDVDGDGNVDLILGGNFYEAKPEVGINDASFGLLLKGGGKGNFLSVPMQKSGLFMEGAVRGIYALKNGTGKSLLVITKNNGLVQTFSY